jgi:hypothetical protein
MGYDPRLNQFLILPPQRRLAQAFSCSTSSGDNRRRSYACGLPFFGFVLTSYSYQTPTKSLAPGVSLIWTKIVSSDVSLVKNAKPLSGRAQFCFGTALREAKPTPRKGSDVAPLPLHRSRRRDLWHDNRAFKGASKQSVGQTIVDVRAATAGALVFVGAAGDFVSVLLEVRTLFPRIE